MLTATPALDRTQRAELAKAASSQEILAAARRVFATRGFRGTTIADIAEDAQIALGTIYLYFPSKEAVFAALNQRFSEMIANGLTGVPAAPSLEDGAQRVDNVFAVCGENRDLVRLVVLNTDPNSEVSKRLRKAEEARSRPMVRALEREMERDLIRRADACVATKLITGLVSFAVYQAFVVSDGKEADKYRQACADMILAYLTPGS
jgi:AcrR family transcriptional regulator